MPVVTYATTTAATGAILLTDSTVTGAATSVFTIWEEVGSSILWAGVTYAWAQAAQVMDAAIHRVTGIEEARVWEDTAPARKRAQRLLEESLTPAQRESLAANGYFEVTTPGTRVTYRIHRMWSRNIQIVNGRGPGRDRWLCIHPRIATPVEDSMLAQKVMLESGLEQELLQTANHS